MTGRRQSGVPTRFAQDIAPVADAISVRLRDGSKPKNSFATFSSLAASGLVLLEAVESRLVSKDTLCSPPSGSALARPPGRALSRQSQGSHTLRAFRARQILDILLASRYLSSDHSANSDV